MTTQEWANDCLPPLRGAGEFISAQLDPIRIIATGTVGRGTAHANSDAARPAMEFFRAGSVENGAKIAPAIVDLAISTRGFIKWDSGEQTHFRGRDILEMRHWLDWPLYVAATGSD